MYRVGFEMANLLKVSLVTAAAMVAICLLALVETTNTAEATSLPNNGKIAFSSNQSGSDAIYTVEPDGSTMSQLTQVPYETSEPNWSPDGRKVALVRAGRREVYISVTSADGSTLRNLHTFGIWSSGPTWSTDGTKLAFNSYGRPPHHYMDIYMMDSNGSNLINLTKSPGLSEAYPDFSPNGSQMCFSNHSPPKPPSGTYVMDADGSDSTLLFEQDQETIGACDWSPDGTKIALHAVIPDPNRGDLQKAQEKAEKAVADRDEEVYVINADGSDRTALTSNSASDIHPDWSPDGTKITFASNRDGDFDIYTMDSDGSNVAQVTNARYDDLDPDWQPLPKPTPPKSRSETVHPPDTGGPSLLLAASALLFSVGVLFNAAVKRRM